MKKHIANFFIMFFVQIIMYVLLIINFRAISQANYAVSVLSDVVIAAMGFFVLKKILSEDGSISVFIGYVAGSAAVVHWEYWYQR